MLSTRTSTTKDSTSLAPANTTIISSQQLCTIVLHHHAQEILGGGIVSKFWCYCQPQICPEVAGILAGCFPSCGLQLIF